jgi:hypothetical protein
MKVHLIALKTAATVTIPVRTTKLAFACQNFRFRAPPEADLSLLEHGHICYTIFSEKF